MSTKGKVANPYTIKYIIDYSDPIELTVFTKALTGFSSEYKKFIVENYGGQHPTDAKLHIEKIKEGSLITQLVEYASVGLPFLGDINTVLDFGVYLKQCFDFFSNKGSEQPKYDVSDLENLANILAPGTEVNNSTNITVEGNNNQVLILNVDSDEANEIQNRIFTAKKELLERNEGIYYKQAFYWEQAKNSVSSQSGYFGIIEKISTNRLKVIFENDEIKKEMIKGNSNPFTNIYIVDVEVQTIREVPKIYKIIKLHEIIADE